MENDKINNIRENSSLFRDKLVELIMLSLGQRPPAQKLDDCPRIILRDSLFYRMKAVNYHLNALINTHNRVLKKMEQNKFAIDEILIGRGQDELSYLFDDIVFNLCSLLDYFGDLIGVIYISDHKQSIKWKGCCKSARDDNNEFSKRNVAKVIDQEDRDWVDRLYEYRAKLIHYKKDKLSSSQHIQFTGNDIAMTFKVDKPEMFSSIIKLYSKAEDSDNHSIIELTIWLVDKCYDSLVNLTKQIELDIK